MTDEKKDEKQPIIPAAANPGILIRQIEDEMTSCYMDYAMSVIIGRALPDVRDGLKPVHRRVLYSMKELGLVYSKATMKCARIVGDCLGKYHPHGDMAVYDTLVRMANFTLRYPLVFGQGNFGSVDGDNAAAMRYTEAKLAKIAEEMLADLDKESVDFVPNFDGTLQEPSVLPAKLPNLLINGSSGIAVGMATNIPPHNISEICDAVVAAVNNSAITTDELCRIVKGPDFPTAGIIYGRGGIKSAYSRGIGKVLVRARTEIEEKKGRQRIIIKEIPYNVQKPLLVESIVDVIKNKIVEGIADIRDESDKEGVRLILELKQNANPDVILNQLYKHTGLQSTFGIIMLAIVNGSPHVLNLKQVLEHFIAHRKEVIERRTRYELRKAEERKHILDGLMIALKNIDEVVRKIKASKTVDAAKEVLEKDYALSEMQARAILDMKLQRLSSLEQEKIIQEHKEVCETISHLKFILASEKEIMKIIREETIELKKVYGDERKTEIAEAADSEISIEKDDIIEEESTVVTLTKGGYIKRTPLSDFRVQNRGGKGLIGTETKDEDVVTDIKIVSTHSFLLFFTDRGMLYKIKAYEIPDSQRASKGRPVVNFLQMEPDEKVTEIIEVPDFSAGKFIVLATRNGLIKRSPLEEYNSQRASIKATILEKDDSVVGVSLSSGSNDIILATRKGSAARFSENELRSMGRVTRGVIGIKLEENDHVIEMLVADEKKCLFTVSEKGFGKRTPVSEYRRTGRSVKGVTNIKLSEKTGEVVGVKEVEKGDELMLITKSGSAIRFPAEQASLVGRHAHGVHLIKLDSDDLVVSIAKIAKRDLEMEAPVRREPEPADIRDIPVEDEDDPEEENSDSQDIRNKADEE
jgi:DNA gyrase subunit A